MFPFQLKHVILFLLFFLIGLGGIIFYISNTSQKKAEERKVIAAKSAFSLENAPKESIRGEITTFSGEVSWESRTATEPGTLAPNTKIQQGEMLQTGRDGSITVIFPSLGELSLKADTEVAVIQTLPTSFVLNQRAGSVRYTSEETTPIAIRSLHLLANIKGEATLTVDDEEKLITISVTDGGVTLAYNNTENISQIQLISKGETVTFNDETREITLE